MRLTGAVLIVIGIVIVAGFAFEAGEPAPGPRPPAGVEDAPAMLNHPTRIGLVTIVVGLVLLCARTRRRRYLSRWT